MKLIYALCIVSAWPLGVAVQAQEPAGNITVARSIFLNNSGVETKTIRVEAEDADAIYDTYHYDSAISIGSVNDPEESGAEGLNSCWNSNFAVYNDIDFGANSTQVSIRKGYPRGSKMELWIDRTIDAENKSMSGGTLIGSIEFPKASTDWNRWQTFELAITPVSGVHDLCIVFLAGGGSAENQNYGGLNWLEFTSIEEGQITGLYKEASERYASFSVNGVEIPVFDGADPDKEKDFLDYDFVRFSADAGTVTARVQCTSKISSISISPLKLNIEANRIDDYTYEFDVPDPRETPYYLLVTINGKRLAVIRDEQEAGPTLGADSVFNVATELEALGVDATQMANATQVSQAFQAAMDKAHAYGNANTHRGVVYVPGGIYYMANLTLKSNTALYLSEEAVLRFTDNKEDYSDNFIKASLWSDDPAGRHGTWWLCTEEGASNIKIYGHGTLDGNGYYLQKQAPRNRMFCNHVITLMQASNVEIDGITVLQSAFWGTMIARSNDVRLTNIKFLNSMDANENDGIDVCESQNVTVDRAIGISLDDPFSTKTWAGTEMMINWYGKPEQLNHVIFDHCVSLTYCGGFKLGHGAMQHQNDITVRNGVVVSAGRAIGIEPKYGNPSGEPVGGFSNMLFENIDIEGAGGEGWLKIVAETPNVGNPPAENITLRNINIRSKGSPSTLRGADEQNMIEGVTFDNIFLYGNTEPVSSLAELNILNTGYYKNVTFVQDRSKDETYLIEAEYYNENNGGSLSLNEGEKEDTDHTNGYLVSEIMAGNSLGYRNVDFGSGTESLIVRASVNRADHFTVEVWLDAMETGTLAGSAILVKDDNQAWTNTKVALNGVSGVHNVYLVFKSDNDLYRNIGAVNYFELQGRAFVNLEALVPQKEEVDVNIEQSTQLAVNYSPENAYQRDVVWSLESATPENCVELDKNGLVKGLAVGKAVVRATSTYDASIYTDITVNVVDELEFGVVRIEAEDADAIYDTYHYDSAISIGSVNDPDDPDAEGLNSCWNGNFAVYNGIDFQKGAVKATIRKGYPRGSKMELWVDRIIDEENKSMSGGTLIGSVEFPAAATDWNRWQTFETALVQVEGVHDLCLVFLAGGGSAENQNYGALNWIDLTCIKGNKPSAIDQTETGFKAYSQNGILHIVTDEAMTVNVYNLTGQLVKQLDVTAGEYVIEGLERGVYIVNNNKVML